jgi:hypothetical protein
LVTAIVGFMISAPLYFIAIWKIYVRGFSFLAGADRWLATGCSRLKS